jgi:hypothetical protein
MSAKRCVTRCGLTDQAKRRAAPTVTSKKLYAYCFAALAVPLIFVLARFRLFGLRAVYLYGFACALPLEMQCKQAQRALARYEERYNNCTEHGTDERSDDQSCGSLHCALTYQANRRAAPMLTSEKPRTGPSG